MSTTGTLIHRTPLTGVNNTLYQASKNWANDSLVMGGGATGALLIRDTGKTDGWGWVDAVAVGQVLASAGVGVEPAWTATPSVTAITVGSNVTLGATPSLAGVIRLPNNSGIGWRNTANDGNHGFNLLTGDLFTLSAPLSITGGLTLSDTIEMGHAIGGSVTPLSIQSADATKGPWQLVVADADFLGTMDSAMYLGYNVAAGGGNVVDAEPSFRFAIEQNFDDGLGDHKLEAYLEWRDGSAVMPRKQLRPLFWQFSRDTGDMMACEIRTTNGVSFNHWEPGGDQWAILGPESLQFLGSPAQADNTQLVLGAQNGKFAQIEMAGGLQILPNAINNWVVNVNAVANLQLTSGGRVAMTAGQGTLFGMVDVKLPDALKDTHYGLYVERVAAQTTSLFRIATEAGPGTSFFVVEADGLTKVINALEVGTTLKLGATTISETEIGYLDGLTTGTVTASKALVVDANKDLASLRNLTATTVAVGPGDGSTTTLHFGTAGTGFQGRAASVVGIMSGGTTRIELNSAEWRMASTVLTGWTSGGANSSLDTPLAREGAGWIFQRNGSSAQRASWANTYTSATNYEAFGVDWQTTANVALVGTRTAATGTFRPLRLVSQSSSGADNFSVVDLARTAPFVRLDSSTAALGSVNNTSTGNFFQIGGALTSTVTSGTNAWLAILPIYNQASGTAANTDLLINRTQTAVGSGTQLLIDAQVGGVSRFSVRNDGVVSGVRYDASNTSGGFRYTGGAGNAAIIDSTSGASIRWGAGSPEGVVTAPVSSVFVRTDGGAVTTLYIKESGAGNTGWVAK
jgi:hypothetical protein